MRLAALLLLALLPAGCVRRGLVVETEPPGAEVWIDGDLAGLSPVRTPFAHYGTREIVVAKGGYRRVQEHRPVEPPWFERFPLDFFTENLWPGTFVDERYLVYTLQPETVFPDEVLARAQGIREGTLKPKETEQGK